MVEVMVVVSIIGVLVAVGYPMLRTYQYKARQNEAKEQLAMIYLIEQDTKSEYFSYGTCLSDLGYSRPQPANQYYYTVGFLDPAASIQFVATASSIQARGGICSPSAAEGQAFFFGSKDGCCRTALVELLTVDNFIAGAGALFTGIGFDRWSIDDAKTLTNFDSPF